MDDNGHDGSASPSLERTDSIVQDTLEDDELLPSVAGN